MYTNKTSNYETTIQVHHLTWDSESMIPTKYNTIGQKGHYRGYVKDQTVNIPFPL